MQWGLNGLSKLKRHISSILVDRYFQDLGEASAIVWIRFNGQKQILEISGKLGVKSTKRKQNKYL